jgi:hypothetical protein
MRLLDRIKFSKFEFFSLIFLHNNGSKGELWIPEDPAFSTGVGKFSNSNSFVLDQLIGEPKTDFKTPTSPILNPVWYKQDYSKKTIQRLLDTGIQGYFHLKMSLPPVLKAGSSGI